MGTRPAARSAVSSVTAAMPRLAVAAVDTNPYNAIRRARPRSRGPPDSLITNGIAIDCIAVAHHTAIITAVQLAATPSPSTERAAARAVIAHTLSSAASERLKPSFKACCRWTIASTMNAPTTRASTTSPGVERNMPMTSGTSLNVNECASSPISMWIASRSASAKPTASTYHGIRNGAGIGARSRTISW